MDDFYLLKKQLYQQCLAYAEGRISAARHALDEVQNSVGQDTKSSAGDKYETGREMLQQETNRYMAQLQEAQKLKHALGQVKVGSQKAIRAEAGSIALTTSGNFYLAVSAGILTVNEVNYYAISPASPIGLKLTGMQVEDTFVLNQKTYTITAIY